MNKNILLVEDDSAIIDIYQTVMTKNGFTVEVISLGADVIKKVQEISAGGAPRPDIILLDLILPDMNGTEILREVRAHQETKDIKVFILSNQEDVERQLPEGIKADKIMVKANVTPTDLVEIIKKEIA